jgi:hypothetical protein
MATNYRHQSASQRRRRAILDQIRGIMGDALFAAFVIDTFSEHGGAVQFDNLLALAALWLRRKVELLDISQ